MLKSIDINNGKNDYYELLIKEALKIRKKSYCKYSDFSVGAALLLNNGLIFRGCNIENLSYGPSVCAERVAFFNAISSDVDLSCGYRAVAVVGGKNNNTSLDFCTPCGVCRQVMKEFCKEDFEIIVAKTNNEIIIDYKIYLLNELLPHSFDLV